MEHSKGLPLPLYWKIYQKLLSDIKNNVYKYNDKLPTLRELSQKLKLSLGTILKAIELLKDDGYVESRPGKGTVVIYQPTKTLTASTTTRKVLLGVRNIDCLFKVYYLKLIDGIRSKFKIENIELNFATTNSKYKEFKNYPSFWSLAKDSFSGLILMDDITHQEAEFLKQMKIPLVLIRLPVPGYDFNFVCQDDFYGAYKILEHLINLGHRRIACITGPKNSSGVKRMLAAYYKILRENKIKINKHLIIDSGFSPTKSFISTIQLLKSKDRPTAIFAHDDEMAIAAIEAARLNGFKVPEDIAIVGFNDTATDPYYKNFLTTVRVPLNLIGETAAQLLIDLMKTGRSEAINNHFNVFIKPEIIIRKSCGMKKTMS